MQPLLRSTTDSDGFCRLFLIQAGLRHEAAEQMAIGGGR